MPNNTSKNKIIKKYKRIYMSFAIAVLILQITSPPTVKYFFDFETELTLSKVVTFSFIFTFTSVWLVILMIAELNEDKEDEFKS